MDGFDISGIKSVRTGVKPSFEPFGKEIEVAEVAVPVGLRDDCHLVSGCFQGPAYDCCAEGGMVYIGIS